MSIQRSNEQRLRAAIASDGDTVVSHGLAHQVPQDYANIYYFSKGGQDVFDAIVQDHDDRVVFRFANNEGQEETRVYGINDEVVAIIDWDVHLQPVLKYGGEEMKVKKWIARVPGNTGPVISHNGHLYEWIQEQFYAVVRSSPEAERKAVIFNDKDIPAVEMTPEGLHDNLLLPIVLFTAFTECGLVKGHGFPGAGEDTIAGHTCINESFLGVDGKSGENDNGNEDSASTEGGPESEAH
ncbi:hypothetical protein SCHPADRAFT_944871 [Schizopora paradoxa]|uniref:Uncharacterized protein n=1 Tax=Schizopora paradoxa TaxID=27342 RepID=A0A0H2RSW3_9AGAM|nr:hypothetical protein SCHPADRAFT_944871 [Schizopora paradoxa]